MPVATGIEPDYSSSTCPALGRGRPRSSRCVASAIRTHFRSLILEYARLRNSLIYPRAFAH